MASESTMDLVRYGAMAMETYPGPSQEERAILTQEDFNRQNPPQYPAMLSIKKQLQRKRCKESCFIDILFALFPFLRVLYTYKIKEYLVGDIVSGLSVGVLHAAQGMGFGLLASLQPIHGLYSSFFPLLLYFFFGTSRHISFGTMALTAILVADVVNREYPKHINSITMAGTNSTNTNGTSDQAVEEMGDEVMSVKLGIAMSLSLVCGMVQVGMGIFRLGFITTYLSDAFIGGFTTGAAFHITTSQIKTMLGLKLKGFNGPFNLIFTYMEIFKNITNTNIASLCISVICLVVILVVKVCINQRFSKKLKVPIPIDLIVLIIGTVASHFMNLKENYGVAVIGTVPQGIPPPSIPPLEHAPSFITDAVILAIVSFAISISMAKIFTTKYHYEVDNNQELLAYGLSNGIGSFFSCFVGAVAPPRTMLHDSAGGKTQLHSVVSAILVLIVILALSPLFASLPNCVLAAVIVAALQKLFMQFENLPQLWRVSMCDFFIWFMTWMAVVILDIGTGLGVGLAFSFITVIMRTQFARGYILVKTEDMDKFVSAQHYPNIPKAPSSSNISIFQFQSALYFANAELFKEKLFKMVGKPRAKEEDRGDNELSGYGNGSGINRGDTLEMRDRNLRPVQGIPGNGTDIEIPSNNFDPSQSILILDCTRIVFIDSSGIKALRQVYNEYKHLGVTVFMAGCTEGVYQALQNGKYFDHFPSGNVFMTTMDAYAMASICSSSDNKMKL